MSNYVQARAIGIVVSRNISNFIYQLSKYSRWRLYLTHILLQTTTLAERNKEAYERLLTCGFDFARFSILIQASSRSFDFAFSLFNTASQLLSLIRPQR